RGCAAAGRWRRRSRLRPYAGRRPASRGRDRSRATSRPAVDGNPRTPAVRRTSRRPAPAPRDATMRPPTTLRRLPRSGRRPGFRREPSGAALLPGPLHRELDWLLIAQDGHSQLVTGLDGLERFDDLGQVGVRRDGHALDREHDVAADDDLLALDDPDAIASAESEAGSDGILHHLLDQESTLLRHLEGFGHR